MTMVKEGCHSFIKSIKEEITGQVDDKCKLEVELMSHLAMIDNESRSLEEQMKEKLKRLENEEEELKRTAAVNDYKEDASEDSNISDELETKIKALQNQIEVASKTKQLMEEDLQNVVDERNCIISEFEKVGSMQDSTINELRLQIEEKRRHLHQTPDT
uniref:Uncharacterized protein n=1 Tax=Ditylum brightwellii TaxID=49249 RepID=A0A7S4RXS1_9STRA